MPKSYKGRVRARVLWYNATRMPLGAPDGSAGAGAQPETDMNPFFPVAEFPDFPAMTPAAAEEALQRWRNDDAQGGKDY